MPFYFTLITFLLIAWNFIISERSRRAAFINLLEQNKQIKHFENIIDKFSEQSIFIISQDNKNPNPRCIYNNKQAAQEFGLESRIDQE